MPIALTSIEIECDANANGTVRWALWFCLCIKSAFHGSWVEECFCSTYEKNVHFNNFFFQRTGWELLKIYGILYVLMCVLTKDNLSVFQVEVTNIWNDPLYTDDTLCSQSLMKKPKLLHAYTTDNNIFRSNIVATFSADQLPLVCFQMEDLRWFLTNLTPSSLLLSGLGWTHFCSACCPTRTQRPEWHFLPGTEI